MSSSSLRRLLEIIQNHPSYRLIQFSMLVGAALALLLGLPFDWKLALVVALTLLIASLLLALLKAPKTALAIGGMSIPSFAQARKDKRPRPISVARDVFHWVIDGPDCLIHWHSISGTSVSAKPYPFDQLISGDCTIEPSQLRARYRSTVDGTETYKPADVQSVGPVGTKFRLTMPTCIVEPGRQFSLQYCWSWPGTMQRLLDYVFAFAIDAGGTEDLDAYITFKSWMPEHVHVYALHEFAPAPASVTRVPALPPEEQRAILASHLRELYSEDMLASMSQECVTYHVKCRKARNVAFLISFSRIK